MLPFGSFCNTFDLHYVIIVLENQFSVFLRVAACFTQVLLYTCMSFKGDYSVVEKTCGQNQAYCIERPAEFSWRHIGADSCSSTIAKSSL